MSVEYSVYERWETALDEWVYGYCTHLQGAVFKAGTGPVPPLHPNCRCRRAFSHRVAVPQSPVEPEPAPVPTPPPAAEPMPAPPLFPPIFILPSEPDSELPPLVIRPVYPSPPHDEEDA